MFDHFLAKQQFFKASFGRLLKAVHLSSDRSNLNLDIIKVRVRFLLSPECLFMQQHLFEVSGCESQERGFFITMLYNETEADTCTMHFPILTK